MSLISVTNYMSYFGHEWIEFKRFTCMDGLSNPEYITTIEDKFKNVQYLIF
jgi:hypothetical protein